MPPPTLDLKATPETHEPHRQSGPVARAAAAVPPPGLLLVSIVSIQLGAAVAVQLFETLGPAGTTFLRIALAAVLLLAATRRRIGADARRHVGLLLVFGIAIGAMNLFQEAMSALGHEIRQLDEWQWQRVDAYPGWEGTRDVGAGVDMSGWLDEIERFLDGTEED